MTCGLEHANDSLPAWQAVKLTFFAPCHRLSPSLFLPFLHYLRAWHRLRRRVKYFLLLHLTLSKLDLHVSPPYTVITTIFAISEYLILVPHQPCSSLSATIICIKMLHSILERNLMNASCTCKFDLQQDSIMHLPMLIWRG